MSKLHRKGALKPGVAAVAMALVAAACGGANGGSGAGGGNGEVLTGSVNISGSSTVEPISAAVGEKFLASNPEVRFSLEGPGTSDGFELFCNGETDISNASRPIDPEEVKACKANGIEFVELKVGIDGLSVITSTENNEVSCLDFKDLYALIGPESQGFGNWSDANSLGQEIGAAHAPYPDAPLEITAPGEESGTFDSFVELALGPVADELGVEEFTTTANYQSSGDDNAIIQGIAGSEDSPETLGWVGFAYVEENLDLVKPLAVDGGEGCVEPTVDTIASGEYPIARPLFIYVDAAAAEENAALTAFIDFYLSDEGRASVAEVGYVDIPDEDWQATVETWESRTTGTQVGG
jgi:phosphate transport system substrate-binding protein